MDTKEYIQGLIDRARTAQQEFETYSQEQVDKAVRGFGKIIYDNGEMLARMGVDETRMGKYGCVAPTTNPTMTPNHNAMIALKGGNAIIVCPHPRAKETGIKTVELMRQALREVMRP